MTTTQVLIWLLIPASIFHIIEEYCLPGGFYTEFKKMMHAINLEISIQKIILINCLFITLILISVIQGESNLFLVLVTASLCMTNGMLHLLKAIQKKGYFPGAITSAVCYIPLGILSFSNFPLTTEAKILAGLTGISLHTIPLIILLIKK